MEKSNIIEKVRKLLAHKENPNKNEAENAMLLAQKLMMKNNLQITDINTQSINKIVVDN